jgi:hypothetical protein
MGTSGQSHQRGTQRGFQRERSRRTHLGVLVERSRADLERRGDPVCPPAGQLLVRNVHLERVVDGVDRDDVAVLDERYRTTDLGFGDDVADNEAVRSVRGKSKQGVCQRAIARSPREALTLPRSGRPSGRQRRSRDRRP